jgi:hypothetical protein
LARGLAESDVLRRCCARVQRFATLVLLAFAACAEAPESATAARAEVDELLRAYGLEPEVATDAVALLAWQVPTQACAHAYRVSAVVEPVLMHEAPSISTFTLAATKDAPELDAGPPAPGQIVPLDIYYRGLRAEKRGLIRDGWASAEFLGPAAPTAACMARTWDPVEDTLALGWPRVPARMTAVGETWTGLRVEGKCNRAACVDPVTGGGGPDNHHRACVTMSWRETLVGVYTIGEERVALVRSHWDDGHAGLGLESDRVTLVSLDHGRPIFAKMTLQHRFPELVVGNEFSPVVRTWTLESADTCPGSLASLGFPRRADDLVEVEAALAQLADIEGLRERDRRTTRVRDPEGVDQLDDSSIRGE